MIPRIPRRYRSLGTLYPSDLGVAATDRRAMCVGEVKGNFYWQFIIIYAYRFVAEGSKKKSRQEECK